MVSNITTNFRIKIKRSPALKDRISNGHLPCKRTNVPLIDPNKPTQIMVWVS